MEFLIISLNRLFGLIAFGSSMGARYWFIALVSLLSALVFLYLFKLVSNQQRIVRYKNRIWGNLLQMRIYQDSLRVIISSIAKVLWYNLLYLKEMLLPLVVMLPVLALFTIQVNNYCGYAGLPVGAKAKVRAVAANGVDFDSLRDIELKAEGGLELQTPALRVPDEAAIYWRVGVQSTGVASALLLEDGAREYRKTVAVSGAIPEKFDPVRCKWSWGEGLLHNAEGFLPADSPVQSISIDYPRQQYPLLWWDTDSLVVYFVLVLVFALTFKPLFRVTL